MNIYVLDGHNGVLVTGTADVEEARRVVGALVSTASYAIWNGESVEAVLFA